MSKRGVIQPTPPSVCAFCFKLAELRPYGPERESICFSCTMKDVDTTERRASQHLFGERFINDANTNGQQRTLDEISSAIANIRY